MQKELPIFLKNKRRGKIPACGAKERNNPSFFAAAAFLNFTGGKMLPRTITLSIIILALSIPFTARADFNSLSGQPAQDGNADQAKYVKLSSELRQLESGLPAKKTELARLHRKWVVAKGRMPSAEEIKEFEEKSAEGAVKVEDNPFVNKSALSTPGRHRVAYFQKLYEIRSDEARIATLRNELHALGR